MAAMACGWSVGSRRRSSQTCVVTLEPIQNEVDEAIDLVFIAAARTRLDGRGREAPLAIDADEPPEPLRGGVVDLGAVATEFLHPGNRSLSAQAGRGVRGPARPAIRRPIRSRRWRR